MPFDPVDPKQPFPELERGILSYWREEDIFKRTISHRTDGDAFSFYDGPPFATGLPHYGHLLAGTIKDVIPRYQTMRGKRVNRRFGWDCHGLPVEYEIEKEHGLKSKKDIEKMGVAAFNNLCRSAVLRYTDEWRRTVERMGRFVDMDHDYRTMDPEYMESIWWVMHELHEKGLLYEGHKPMHLCPRCETPLSNFEVTQGYKDVTDVSVTAKFRLKDGKDGEDAKDVKESRSSQLAACTYILAWTTTPWTLPGNLFLAINPNMKYVKVRHEGSNYILAEAHVDEIFKNQKPETSQPVTVRELLDTRYEPLFPYFAKDYAESAFKIVEGDFVTTEDGTGIVHIAPGFGDDDFAVGKREGVKLLQHVKTDGTFVDAVKDFAGLDVKPKDDPTKTDKKVIAWLEKNGSVFSTNVFRHSYPHCWRCDSPLLNYAASSWFVAVEKIKKNLINANKETEWVPSHIRDGRFGKWLEGARDWAVSRDRYWGTPLPIWRSKETDELRVITSRDELLQAFPHRFTKITLIRHGESTGNVDQIYQGSDPGTDLTDTGKKKAKETAAHLKNDTIPVTTIYASPLNRTQQTAAFLSKETNTPVTIDGRIREVHFGDYEGKHVDFSDLAFVKARRAHKLDKNQVESIYHFEGMETWDAIEERCRAFLKDVLPRHRGEHIAIVTHADLVMNFAHIFTEISKHKIVHQPYPALAGHRTFYWDHVRGAQMDLHKETVDALMLPSQNKKGQMLTFTFVRHGETDLNKAGKVQGSDIDASLNETGKGQIAALAKKLKAKDFDGIVCSDLARAIESAQILADALGLPVLERSPLLRERNLSGWSGKTLQEIADLAPAADPMPNPAFHFLTPPDGESLGEFIARGEKALGELCERQKGKRLLLVSHRGMIQMLRMLTEPLTYREAVRIAPANGETCTVRIPERLRRIPDVLDCWFESGSMPYAQAHWPFEAASCELSAARKVSKSPNLAARSSQLPPHFPADFIAEGLDQTRGWFYTLMVLSTALYDQPAFRHCVVNGTVLAEDGKKMSKRLKNYPEPTEVVEKFGADAIRFALMHSPAVRGEDLRISEKVIEEKVRNILLPLWNAYSFLVTYANAAGWEPPKDFALAARKKSDHLLDEWIAIRTQDLVNKMTDELERYDLSATCDHLADAIDGLTNWYIRLSRRRFAGKSAGPRRSSVSAAAETNEDGVDEAGFDTLYRALLTTSQLLAPFCPFLTDAMYLNLVRNSHGSIHLTDWPKARKLTKEEQDTLARMDTTRTIVGLGLSLRSDAKIKVRQPLAKLTYALPPHHEHAELLFDTIREELNVKEIVHVEDAADIAETRVEVDARKVGPRVGAKVQELIRAAKSGDFTKKGDMLVILGEELSAEEARIVYRGKVGENVASDKGIVVALDTQLTGDLKKEGLARDLIRAVQQLRKDAGLTFTDRIALSVDGVDDVLETFGALISEETRAELKKNDGAAQAIVIEDKAVTVKFTKL